jgi:hypothetical protein
MRSDSIRSSRRFLCPACALLACSLLVVRGLAYSQSATQTAPTLPSKWDVAVRTLAGKIADLADQSKPASLEVKNTSSLNATKVSAIGESLQAQLSQRLHLVAEPGAETQIIVTLSQGTAGYVWVAQVRSGSSERVAMVPVASEGEIQARGEQPAMSLQRKLVWSQREPFLDFAVPDATSTSASRIVILEPTRIISYQSGEGQWAPRVTIAVHPTAPLPRDARGTIWEGGGELEALLPGEACSGVSANILSLNCAPYPSRNPEMTWPVVAAGSKRVNTRFQSNRNFFDGLAPVQGQEDAKWPAFYTAAAMGGTDGASWLLAELDGKARLHDATGKASATFSGWGDDIAGVQTGCGPGSQVLVTGTGDWTQPDHIQMYEISDHQGVAAGEPIDFPGPILALWPSTDLKSARVVSRNLQTGMYEASIVSVSCSE